MNKVLIVEDEEILVKVLREKFIKEKFEVKVATDGDMALPRAKEFRPDIVVLDLILPKKDGFEVLKDLKSDSDLKNIPVLILSNLGQDEEIKKGLSLGAANYFVKTQHSIREVVEEVKRCISKSRS